jgi:arginyl-tRNA synthetase
MENEIPSDSISIRNSSDLEAVIETELKAILSELGVAKFADNFSYSNVIVSKEKGYDFTLNIFAFAKDLKKKPEDLAQLVYEKLVEKKPFVFDGFLRTGTYAMNYLQIALLFSFGSF